MNDLKTLLLSPQLNATEFAARTYPERARKPAGQALKLVLHGAADLPAATTREAADLAAFIRRSLGTDAGLGRVVADARLRKLPFALLTWPNAPQRTAQQWQAEHQQTGIIQRDAAERLRAALNKLADELATACN